ncbi:MAG: DHH family phosphoesterase [Thermoplasmatota archaeon]
MPLGGLERLASELSRGRKLVLLHPGADPDALGSALALRRAFPDVDISSAGGLSRLSKRVLELAGESVVESPDFSRYDTLVVLDTSNTSALGVPEEVWTTKRRIVIDHHMRSATLRDVDVYYTDDTKPSCAELVWGILQERARMAGGTLPEGAGRESQGPPSGGGGPPPGAPPGGPALDRGTALALAAGILTDTAHFRFARSGTLRTLGEILERSGLALEEVLGLLSEEEPDVSRKTAFLKGAQRLRFERAGEWFVAVSHVSAFEGALCRTLLSLGADVAFVAAQEGRDYRVSGRASQALVRRGLHIGRLMEEAGRELGGQGGGHAGAAGMSGVGEMEAALNILMQRAVEALRELAAAGRPGAGGPPDPMWM